MKRLPVYAATFLSSFLLGSNVYGQLPDKPEEGEFEDKNNGITYYLSNIPGTDYYTCGHFITGCEEWAKDIAKKRRNLIVSWDLTSKELKEADNRKVDRILDDTEFGIIEQKYGNKKDSLSVDTPTDF